MTQGGHFDLEEKEKRIKELENITKEENFWQNIEAANQINQELASLKKEIETYLKTKQNIVDNLELIDILSEEELESLLKEIPILENKLEELELSCLLKEENDKLNCYLEIHPGAGGTESCDWASMLFRMYQRFCENMNYKYEIIDSQKGDEAGLKSVTIYIKAVYSYGYLKKESGVHR